MDAREVKQIAGQVFDTNKYRIRTHVIAQVETYDTDKNTVTVQPVTKAVRFTDPENITTVELPQISEVPVIQVGSGKLWCTVAPAVDTYGLLHISDRIIDDWLSAGGIVDPTGIRCHDLSDAIFEPSLLHLVDEGDNGLLAVPVATDRISLRTRAGNAEISVLDDETIEIKTAASTVSMDVAGKITLENSSQSLEVGSAAVAAGNGSDFVAMAAKVDMLWTTLYTLFTTGWIVAPADGGAALKAAFAVAFPPPGPNSVASTNLKAE